MEGITLTCSDGIELHGQRWRKRKRRRRRRTVDEEFTVNDDSPYAANCKDHSTPPTTRRLRILCLHGFLDNCRSHYLLGPNLVTHLTEENNDNDDDEVDVDVVTIDLPGHGWSSHKSRDVPASWLVSDYCYYIAETVTRLGWTTVGNENQTIQQQHPHPLPWNNDESFVLIGHSFGGAISIEYAATFPEQVQALILLDAHGPDYETPDRISARIRNHVLDRYHYNQKTNNTKDDNSKNNNNNNNNVFKTKQYSNLHAAVQTRMDTARFSPGGHQWLSQEAATELVQRATCVAWDDRTVQFVHDGRLKHSPPLLLPTLDHVLACWNNLTCPVYCLYAKDGWPFNPLDIQRAHDQVSNNNNSNTNLVVETLPGSHHFHADPDTAPRVVEAIVRFLQKAGIGIYC
ncbi:peptidase S33 family protein [Nitzschia inconspicua]|uniref:Peptidase S33 family protein n=1 Tax=Nitzschia inconspicua TaxID=303405 RepID=A0A9K3PF70_9STRA|nr:peptidase S33 family protein [Nitzschia inconspicua]